MAARQRRRSILSTPFHFFAIRLEIRAMGEVRISIRTS
jgi:hypothetical protein